MPLSAGTKLGPYEIVTAIGSGGMGEVYRAKDKRLDRTVAIKVLRSQLPDKVELKQRFDREARAISNLSHPHICTVHDVGHYDGVDYVVMEYLEGQTLAERLTKGALSTAQALQIGIQIADALDKAHKKGIIHRDLKPANIMLTKSGAKLLDFGLAKFQPSVSENMVDQSELPTEEKHLTQEGYIVGTIHYMSPEQLEGRSVDSRTDIFAFGTTLYEMITGKKAFSGTSKANLIVSILEKEPRPISEIQPMTPPALDRTIRTCLSKDPDDRWQNAHDLMSQLKWIAESGTQSEVSVPVPTKRITVQRLAWIFVGLLFLATLGLLIGTFRTHTQANPVTRSLILPPKGLDFSEIALSPDGTKLAFIASKHGSQPHLYVQSVDSHDAKELASIKEEVMNYTGMPFWSPDSRSIAFFADSKLNKVAATGGPVLKIGDAMDPKGGAWGRNGDIVFAPESKGVFNVISSEGGTPKHLSYSGGWPCFLPDGRHFLFFRPTEGIYTGSIDNTEQKFLLKTDSWGIFTQNELLYFQDGNLIAQTFDPRTFALGHDAQVIQQGIDFSINAQWRQFSAAENGLLVTMTPPQNSEHLMWVNRQGKQTGEIPNVDNVINLTISPDSQKILMERMDFRTQKRDLWMHDVARGTTSRFTFHPEYWFNPSFVWSGDSKWVYYGTGRKIFCKATSTVGQEQIIYLPDVYTSPSEVTLDGKFLLLSEVSQPTNWDMVVLPLSGNQKPHVFLKTEFTEIDGKLSPDGRWIVFNSDKSGRYEVYVRPFEHPEQSEFTVSTSGGELPRWRNDGKEIIFYSFIDNKMMAVDVKPSTSGLEFGVPHALFSLPPQSVAWDMLRNFSGFLVAVNTAEEQTSLPLNLITNWPAILQH